MVAVVPLKNSILQSDLLQQFRQLAMSGKVPGKAKPGHRDGWGMVVWQKGKPVYLGRAPTDALGDESFDIACEKLDDLKLSSHLLLHLRKASVGSKTIKNTHPFIGGNWAFAHNGTIYNIPHKSDSTDSKAFFEKIIRKSNRKEMTAAIKDTILEIREKYRYSSITFLLSNGVELFAYREFRRAGDYYQLFHTVVNNRLVVSQERFFDSNWNELDNKQLLHVANSGHSISVI